MPVVVVVVIVVVVGFVVEIVEVAERVGVDSLVPLAGAEVAIVEIGSGMYFLRTVVVGYCSPYRTVACYCSLVLRSR